MPSSKFDQVLFRNGSWAQEWGRSTVRLSSTVLCCKDRNFGMKLYNDQRNAQVFNLFIYLLLLPYMFRAFF
jgi:hypothetical protein